MCLKECYFQRKVDKRKHFENEARISMMDLSIEKKFLNAMFKKPITYTWEGLRGIKLAEFSCSRVAFFTLKDTHALTHRFTISD